MLAQIQVLLLQLAERATDEVPSFKLSFCENRYYEIDVGGITARGVTVEGASARATVQLYNLLNQRAIGDAEVLAQLRVSVRSLTASLSAEENGRQLSLLDRAVLDDETAEEDQDQDSANRLDH